jgi:hypothetical protein
MIQEIAYSYHDLIIDRNYLASMLGFSDGILPEPFNEYLEEAIYEVPNLCDIRGAFYLSEKCSFYPDYSKVIVDDIQFEIGKTLAKELRNSTGFALYICTAGMGIGEESQMLLAGDNPVLGYVYDVLGSMIVEAATDLLQNEIRNISIAQGLKITNRYSPGYCKWSVSDQHKLFSFFPSDCCGIKLTESALMYPIKSVSGIIGIGPEVEYREYTCDLCNQVDCFHRNYQLSKLNEKK